LRLPDDVSHTEADDANVFWVLPHLEQLGRSAMHRLFGLQLDDPLERRGELEPPRVL